MLLVTESAKGALKTVLDNAEVGPGQCVRVKVVPGGKFGLTLDVESQGDHVVNHGDTKVLLVDSETAKHLDGLVLDYRDSGEGPELTLMPKGESKEAGT